MSLGSATNRCSGQPHGRAAFPVLPQMKDGNCRSEFGGVGELDSKDAGFSLAGPVSEFVTVRSQISRSS